MEIQMDPTTKIRAVCFCKNSSSTGCTLKFFIQPYEDILMNDNTVVQRKKLNFEKSSEIKTSDIKTKINEYRLFEKVNINAFVTEVSLVTTTEVYDKCINMQTALVHDKSGTSAITLFNMNCNQIQNNSSLLTSHSVRICLHAY